MKNINKTKLILACIPVTLWLLIGLLVDPNPFRLEILLSTIFRFLMCFLISLEQTKAKIFATIILFVFIALLCYEGYIKAIYDLPAILDYPKFIFMFATYYLVICYWPKKKRKDDNES